MKSSIVAVVLFISLGAYAKEATRKPSQIGGPISISNKSVLVGDLNCADNLVFAQVLVNSLDQKALVSDLTVQGKVIELGQVQTFKLDDSSLLIKAPGLSIQARVPEKNGVGVREGQISINGKKQNGRCFVPEISDFPM